MRIKISKGVQHFLEKAKLAWGIEEWLGEKDPDKDVLFFGLFFQEDYDAFDKLNGNRTIFWCGSDILRTSRVKQWLDVVKGHPAKHYCETEVEKENLNKIGIEVEIIPSFLANVNNFPLSFCPPLEGEKWKIWLNGHPGREKEYGFEDAKEIAKMFDNIEIHFYGVDGQNEGNVFYHGFIPEEQLDKEIRKYHCAIRGNSHDGVSEVVIKSLLLGQYPITKLPYEGVWQYNSIGELARYVAELQMKVEPNYEPRIKWMKRINNFPFCHREYWKPTNES
jgi:hypothetical protein